jgi:hypothetical protein
MTADDRDDLAAAAALFAQGGSIYTVEMLLQVRRIRRAGITLTEDAIEQYLGHTLTEASADEQRGVIAVLNALGRDQ